MSCTPRATPAILRRVSRRLHIRATLLAAAACTLPCGADDLTEALEAVRADESRRISVLNDAARAVVCVLMQPDARAAGGAGVIIDPDGYGLTNFHVIGGFLRERSGYAGLSDGRVYALRLLGVDPGGDVALFRLEGRASFDFAPLGDSDTAQLGQWMAAMGNPFALAEDFCPTITLGVASGLHRYQEGVGNTLEYADCLQVSTSINPGNSGGPLFDLNGRVLGINGRASFEERGRVNVGLGYSVSVNQIKRFLPSLRAGRLCAHGTLGAIVEPGDGSVVFRTIQELGPADRAGVEPGDRLLAVSDRPLRTPNEFNTLLATLPDNWPVTLRLQRGGREFLTATRLARLPLRDTPVFPVDPAISQAECRRLFEAGQRRWRPSGERIASCRWRGVLTVLSEGAAASTVELSGTQSLGGELRIARRDWASEPLQFSTEADAPASAPAVASVAWDSAALWREWLAFTTPLLAPPDADEHYEALGTDAILGDVVAVVEHTPPGGTPCRWKFDYDTGELRGVTCGRGLAHHDPFPLNTDGGVALSTAFQRGSGSSPGEESYVALWLPEFQAGLGAAQPAQRDRDLPWPHHWRRIDNAGNVLTLTLSELTIEPATTAPAEVVEPPMEAPPNTEDPAFAPAIELATQRVVKLYGAHAGREAGYGVGTIVSADGLVVTAQSLLLEGQSLHAILPDGTRQPARVVARDARRQLALLQLDSAGLHFFELGSSAHVRAGDWVLVAANPFKVAVGPEPVSIAAGVVSTVTTLDARRRMREFPYEGSVLIVDVTVSTPGSAGGALVDLDGQLVGVIGRAAQSNFTSTWLNYAIPVEEVADFVRTAQAPAVAANGAAEAARARSPGEAASAVGEPDLGLRLFDLGGRNQPAYVERVRRDSPAQRTGIRPNDLVISLAGRPIENCAAYERQLATLRPGQTIAIVVKRGEQLLSLEITVAERARS